MGRKRRKDKHLPERMYLRSGSYYLVDHLGKWHNLGRNYIKAMGTYAKMRGPDGPCSKFADVIDRYLAEVAPEKAEKTYGDNLKQARYLRAAFGKAAPTNISKQGKVAANRELALLSHMFKKAIRWGVVIDNPCTGIERFKETPRRRYVEDWEYTAFREYADALVAAYMDFKYITGLRKGDILKLKLEQLCDDGIHITVSKSGDNKIIGWTDNLRAAVAAIRALPRPIRGLHLFCTRRGKPYTVSGFTSIWQRKMNNAVAQGILKERFTDHDLRAKTASDTDLEHATKLLTHQDSRTTQRHYRRRPEKIRPLK